MGFREDLDLEDDEEIICPICGSDRLSSITSVENVIGKVKYLQNNSKIFKIITKEVNILRGKELRK